MGNDWFDRYDAANIGANVNLLQTAPLGRFYDVRPFRERKMSGGGHYMFAGGRILRF